MASFMSDGFQEALGESMTALKFGGLVLKEKQKAALYAVTLKKQDVYIIDQARGQDGWILVEFSFCLFMDRDEVEVHENAKRERCQYPAILNELACSMKDLLYGIRSTEKNDLRACLFLSTEKETS